MKYVNNRIFIKEMFPEMDEDVIERLLQATQNNVDLVVTKIIDGTYKGIHFDIKDVQFNKIKQPVHKKDLYFPELIEKQCLINEEVDVSKNRKEIKKLNEEIRHLKTKCLSYKNRQADVYYSEKADDIKEDVKKLNKECTLSILKKALKEPSSLDLHGLFSMDALKFVDDHIRTYSPSTLKLITGSEDSSLSLRPSLIKYLKEKNYTVTGEGPCLIAKKINKL